jgi:hypothetical protein
MRYADPRKEERGLWKMPDGGVTWRKVLIQVSAGVGCVIDAARPNTVYARVASRVGDWS